MEKAGPNRIEPSFALGLLLEIAEAQSLKQVLNVLVSRIQERPGVARVQIWLLDKSDRCLHAVTGSGNTLAGARQGLEGFVDRLAHIPLGVGVIGRIGATGRQIVIRDIAESADVLPYVDWLKTESIRGINGVPISFKGEVLGVIAVFTRESVPEGAETWGRILADYVAGNIAHARAFEEIQRLKAQLEQQNAYLQEEVVEARAFGELVGQSGALRQIVTQIDMVAPTDASVLILGETGTGKELVAREIHRRSGRRERPLIRVNCASIPKELFESEFFGHVKGAFTGAIRDRAGRFETAEGGTLFLDEIGEVPLELQSKLLRVLQEKRYERVGEDRTRRADVRIIGATNRDLKKEAEAGRFREDLFYRLNVFPISVVPLRERRDDIPLLVNHFVELSVKELRVPKPRVTRAGIAQLQSYAWPGNIRELRNVIERAVIIARGGALHFDLPIDGEPPNTPAALPRSDDEHAPEFLTELEMRQHERKNLLAVLNKSDWKIKGAGGAAELLGVKPTTLISRIKKLGLKRQS